MIGVWFLYVALTFKGMLDDWHYFMGETSEGAALITPASVGAVGVLLFILGIKIAHIIWG